MALTVAKTTKFAVLDVARPARGAAAADAAGTREERRLRWLPEMTAACDISGDGRTLTRVHEFQDGWAACTSLPTAGISSFDVRIDVSLANEGLITIGVCDAEANYGWGLCLEASVESTANGHTVMANGDCAPQLAPTSRADVSKTHMV